VAGIMLTEPKTVNSTNYKLLPGKQYKTSRGGKVKACVLHVTAGAQDLGLSGSDPSAENTNKWVLSSGTTASWHRISDSDGVITCLPSWYTAYQAKGYNSSTVGNECCNVDARWDNKPKTWVKWTLWYYALSYADYVVKYKIPLRRATKAELDRAISSGGAPVGFIDHSRLSDNRSDPGKTFPWTQFFGYITAIIAGATSPDKPVTPPKPPVTPTTRKAVPTMLFYICSGLPEPEDAAAIIMSDGYQMRWIAGSTPWARIKASIKDQIGKDPTPIKVNDLNGVALVWVGPLPSPNYPIPSGVKIVTEV
jgi:hypothetical protein